MGRLSIGLWGADTLVSHWRLHVAHAVWMGAFRVPIAHFCCIFAPVFDCILLYCPWGIICSVVLGLNGRRMAGQASSEWETLGECRVLYVVLMYCIICVCFAVCCNNLTCSFSPGIMLWLPGLVLICIYALFACIHLFFCTLQGGYFDKDWDKGN